MKRFVWSILILISCIGGIYLFNYFTLTHPAITKVNSDNRNSGVNFELHYKYFVMTNTLIYNLQSVPLDKAPIDIFRTFLQTSTTLTDKKFETIELDYKGIPKFILKGDYFTDLGKEYDTQNPVYTTRTFPSHLYNLTGEAAYGEWNGGCLGVLGKQIEDFNDFNKKWYLNNITENESK